MEQIYNFMAMNPYFKKLVLYLAMFGIILELVSPLSVLAQNNPALADPTAGIGNTSALNPGLADPTADIGNPGVLNGNTSQVAAASVPQSQSSKVDTPNTGVCSGGVLWSNALTTRCWGWLMMAGGGRVLWVAGIFLNVSIEVSVLGMKKIVDNIGAVNIAWKTFRDLANVFFIFILIYISIATIVGAAEGQTLRLLRNVILVAIFINFSLFFTKVVIDASNIVTTQFYNSITKGSSAYDNGLSQVFMSGSRLTTLFDVANNVGTDQSKKAYSDTNFFLIGFMSMIFFVILAFCFLAIGLLFLIRFGVFLLLMIFSPLAFLGHTVPQLKHAWDKYWHALVNQAIFAPFMMAIIWVVAVITTNGKFISTLVPTGSNVAANVSLSNSVLAATGAAGSSASGAAAGSAAAISGTANFVDAFMGTRGSAILVVVNFAILIILLIGGMIVAKQFGSVGSGAIIGAVDKYSRRFIGGATLGMAARGGRVFGGGIGTVALKSKGFQQFVARNPNIGGMAFKGAEKLARSSYDVRATAAGGALGLGEAGGKGGYLGNLEKNIKERERVAGELEKTKIYADEPTQKMAEIEEGIKKKSDAKVIELNDKISALRTKGIKTEEDRKSLESLERERVAAINSRSDAAKRLKNIQDDQSRTKTGEQVYGENLKKGALAWVMMKLSREREEAAKKIGTEYEKDRYKQETKYADEATVSAIDKRIDELTAQMKESVDVNRDIATLQGRIAENTEKIVRVEQDIKMGQGNIITNNRERDSLRNQNSRYEQSINKLRADGQNAREERDKRIEEEIRNLRTDRGKIKGKQSTQKLKEALKESSDEDREESKPVTKTEPAEEAK